MDNRKEELKRIMNRYSECTPIFIKKLKDDDNTVELNMKESLNRIEDVGDDTNGSEHEGPVESEDAGDI